MNKRPLPVSIVAWYLIVTGSILLVSTVVTMVHPVVNEMLSMGQTPVAMQYVFRFLGIGVILTAGVAILKGKNWARFLYLGWGVIGITIDAVSTPSISYILPEILIYLMILINLLTPKATMFFLNGSKKTME